MACITLFHGNIRCFFMFNEVDEKLISIICIIMTKVETRIFGWRDITFGVICIINLPYKSENPLCFNHLPVLWSNYFSSYRCNNYFT